MSGPIGAFLMAGPLALYLLGLAICYAGRRPRIVAGPVDSAVLGIAIGSLAAFGPVGNVVLSGLPGGLARHALLVLAIVAGTGLSGRSRRRLAIYQVDPGRLDRALHETLLALPGDFARTLRGFEDRTARRGVALEGSVLFRYAEIVAFGSGAEGLIASIEPGLRRRLREEKARGMSLAWLWLGLSYLTVAATMVLARPHIGATLRLLIERRRGG